MTKRRAVKQMMEAGDVYSIECAAMIVPWHYNKSLNHPAEKGESSCKK